MTGQTPDSFHQSGTHQHAQFPIETDGLAHVFFLTNKPGLCRVRVTYQGDPDFVAGASAWKEFRPRSPH